MRLPSPPQVGWSSRVSRAVRGEPLVLHAYLMAAPEGSSWRRRRKAVTAEPILSSAMRGRSLVATVARSGTGAAAAAWRRMRTVRTSRRRMLTSKQGWRLSEDGSTASAGATERIASTGARSVRDASTSSSRAPRPRGWSSRSRGISLMPSMGACDTISVIISVRSALKSDVSEPWGRRTRSMGAPSMGLTRGSREPSHE
mmetsp:Transcript_3893/g.11246  ORF Transcript_3893/g.11246 Transcript_3893/m.11246 type:complete len:200 (+) Transcript_3893:2065-2664(+)